MRPSGVLAPFVPGDTEALLRISNEAGVRRYLWDDAPIAHATMRAIISRSNATFAEEGIRLFGVRRRGTENVIGFCGFIRLEGMDEPALSYELSQCVWGEGLAAEAARVCLRYAFEEVGLERVIAGAAPENVASR